MKLRQLPEDFQVVEESDLAPQPEGRVALYRLKKQGIGTIEALSEIGRRWRVPRARLSVGGLKDAHAITEQWVGVVDGPARDLTTPAFHLRYAGRTEAPLGREVVRANAFRLVLRDLLPEHAALIGARLADAARDGVPNYFDTQRFGSARATGEFPGKRIVTGDPEGAMRLMLATPAHADRRDARERAEILAATWGDWTRALDALPQSSDRSIVAYLKDHPRDFVGAFERMDTDRRHLVLAAWQSLIWDRMVTVWLSRRLGAGACPVQTPYLRLVFWETLPPALAAELEGLILPLPRHDAEYAGEWREIAADVLGSEGVTVEGFRARGCKQTEFRPGLRPVQLRPADASAEPPVPDALNPGRHAVSVAFRLPSGAYATIVVKRLTLGFGGRGRKRGRPAPPAPDRV